MKLQLLLGIAACCAGLACEWPEANENRLSSADDGAVPAFTLEYPATPIDSGQIDTYFGLEVEDPYRWLEQTESSKTRNWVSAQTQLTHDFLEGIPYRKALQQRLRQLNSATYDSAPVHAGGYYYFFRQEGVQRGWYRQRRLGDGTEPVLEASQLPNGVRFSSWEPQISPDGVYAALILEEAGSAFQHIRLVDLRNKRLMPERINRVKHANVAWHGNGFYYARYAEPQRVETEQRGGDFHQIYYHQPGEPTENDRYVFGDVSNPKLRFEVRVTEDERFLLVYAHGSAGTGVYIQDLREEEPSFSVLVPEGKDHYELVGNVADDLILLTSAGADLGRLIRVPAMLGDTAYWMELIPEQKDLLESAHLLGGRLLLNYRHAGASKLLVYNPDGSFEDSLFLPGLGHVDAICGRNNSAQAFFEYSSFYHPTAVYALDMATLEQRLLHKPTLQYEPGEYSTRQVWCKSHDGTRVPILLTHKKNLEADGRRPTLLLGYGAQGQSVLPFFHPLHIALLEQGGLLAVADVRGGGNFLSTWHRGGTRAQKQRSFDDFQAAALHLIQNEYTAPERLAIAGQGLGGLMVAACMEQRPDLFAVALPTDGLYDAMRYPYFEGGRVWSAELGRSDEERSMGWLYAYSPIHQAEPADYPATLMLAGAEGGAMSPAHSYKFAATMQHFQRGRKPMLLEQRVPDTDFAGSLDQAADRLSFMFYQMGVQPRNL